MPLTHLACPESAPSYGEVHEPEYCLTSCANRCLSPFLIAGLMSSNARNHHFGKLLSVTSLTTGGCSRSLVYERTVDYADQPLSNLYAYRGVLSHKVVEDAAQFKFPKGQALEEMGFLTEQSMLIAFCFEHGGFHANTESDPYDDATWHHTSCPECDVLKIAQQDREWFFLSGTLDGFEPHWDAFDPETGVLPGTIHDTKTSMEYSLDGIIAGKDTAKNVYGTPYKDQYCEQLNLYRFLLLRSPVPEPIVKAAKARGVVVTQLRPVELVLQFLSMGKFPRSGQPYMFSNHYTKPKTPHMLPDVPVFEDGWAEAHIKKHGYAPYLALIKGEMPPSLCPPESNGKGAHHWKCGTPDGKNSFCAFAYTREYCPSPVREWEALQGGATPEEAFTVAQAAWDNEDFGIAEVIHKVRKKADPPSKKPSKSKKNPKD